MVCFTVEPFFARWSSVGNLGPEGAPRGPGSVLRRFCGCVEAALSFEGDA